MQAAIKHIRTSLRGLYPDTEIGSFTYLILSKVSGLSRTEIIVNKNTIFSTEQHQEIDSFIEKLKMFVPIQYILGETEFYGLKFSVDNSVLIPRPETEELVEWIQKDNHENQCSILDIGTGSGCIAIALKHVLPQASVSAFDISEDALKTAIKNANLNDVEINFANIDILQRPEFSEKWDIIVSNPPYIPASEKAEILPNVLNHEPHLALFVSDSHSLVFYEEIARFALKQLKEKGKLYFEIHSKAGESCVNLLREMGFKSVELRKDMAGNDRMIKASLEL